MRGLRRAKGGRVRRRTATSRSVGAGGLAGGSRRGLVRPWDRDVTPRVAERSDASLEDDAKAEVRGVGTSCM